MGHSKPFVEPKNLFERQCLAYEHSTFGALAALVTIQSCWAAIAALLCLYTGMDYLIGVAAFLSMGANAAFLAQAPAKIAIGSSWATFVICLVIMIINIVLLV
jgi:hypothetical protein